MTREEFLLLQAPDIRRIIDENIGADPSTVALKVRNPAVATQIKILQKCARKLPSYYAARCIVPTVSYQQASSEAAAFAKDFPAGALAVDLTCGLGVDSLALSHRFDKVISIEKDPLLANIARYNFRELGIRNIEVLTTGAEEFCRDYRGPRADLVYADPARRDRQGHSVYSLEDSSPNVLELLDRIMQISSRQIIKLSPLFDVQEGFRLFGDDCSLEVVSIDDECKEVVIRLGFDRGVIINTMIRAGAVHRHVFDKSTIGREAGRGEEPVTLVSPEYIMVPDVTFYKSRTVGMLVDEYNSVGSGNDVRGVVAGGYIFCKSPAEGFAGKTFRIESSCRYRPKDIVRMLKQRSVRQANIHSRTSGYSPQQIAHALKINLGGTAELFFAECPPSFFPEDEGAAQNRLFFVRRIN